MRQIAGEVMGKGMAMRWKLILAVFLGIFTAGLAMAKHAPVVKPIPTPAPAPAPAPVPENMLKLELSTGGTVTILLRPDKAPLAVERIKTLTRQGFYNGLGFHRVIEGFMAQGGDPKGDGSGGSTYPDLPAEFNDMPHVRGVMAMARAGDPNSANSQFFIMLMPNLGLDGHYTPVGRVISGMDSVDSIAKGEPPANPTKIVRATILGEPVAVEAAPPAPVAAVPSAPAAASTSPVAVAPAPAEAAPAQ